VTGETADAKWRETVEEAVLAVCSE
jgi:hypothetical protein